MLNLMKMEWYKLRTGKLFYLLMLVVFVVNGLIALLVPIVSRLFMPEIAVSDTMASVLTSPFTVGLLLIPVFISAISFLYSDFTGGFVKTIAGQVGNRGKMVIAKFVVLGIHNLFFFAAAALSNVAGKAIAGSLVLEGDIVAALMSLLRKWVLSMAVCSIILFFAVGIRNKTIASIFAVVFATGAFSLLYMGISTAVMNIFKISDFSLGDYLPDSLMNSVNVAENTLVVNGIAVAVIFIGVFVTLTYITFKKRDVK